MEACLVFSDFPLQPVARKKEKKEGTKKNASTNSFNSASLFPFSSLHLLLPCEPVFGVCFSRLRSLSLFGKNNTNLKKY